MNEFLIGITLLGIAITVIWVIKWAWAAFDDWAHKRTWTLWIALIIQIVWISILLVVSLFGVYMVGHQFKAYSEAIA